MKPTAKVYRHSGTPYFQAYFHIWEAKTGKWKPATKSTRCTDETRALGVARKFEQVALAAGGTDGESRITRQFVEDTINSILEAAGLPRYVATASWDTYSQAWLAMQQARISAGSMLAYTSSIASLTKWLGKDKTRALENFTGTQLQAWYQQQIKDGLKPSGVNLTTSRLRAVFARAMSEGFCTRNPVDLIMPQHGGSDKRDIFSPEDITVLSRHLTQSASPDWLTLFLLGLCTGQRLTDCSRADWAQFKEEDNTLVWHLTQRKTTTTVAIPIVEPLASHLRAHRKAKGPLMPSLASVPSGSGNGLSSQFSALLNKSGIDRGHREKKDGSKGHGWNDKTFHSLRHTCNSLLANAGVSDDVRRKILGHASTKMNARYTHLEVATTLAGLKKALGELAKQ